MSFNARLLSRLVAGLTDKPPGGGDVRDGEIVGEDRPVRAVCDDSRRVQPGDLFVAVSGTHLDARRFVADALARGAVAVMAEGQDEAPENSTKSGSTDVATTQSLEQSVRAAGAIWVPVTNARRALAVVASRFFAQGRELSLTAITGTNGKTTTSHLVEAMLNAAGRPAGLIGTVAYRYPGTSEDAPLTTPGSLALHGLFERMRGAGCTDAVLEASSHALAQERLAGCRFRAAGLTNVTQDHLDYHKTMDAYFDAKAILFESLLADGGVGVLPIDREEGRRMRARVRGKILGVATEAGVSADVSVTSKRLDSAGLSVQFATPIGKIEIRSHLVGEFNLSNIALAVGLGVANDLSADAIVRGVAGLAGVPGRLEKVENNEGVLCVVDYAHTPDALERALGVLRPLCQGRLIVVFGCGGDRDSSKRPVMGEVAARLGDILFVTSDNPRTEDPVRILQMIVTGVDRTGIKPLSADAFSDAIDDPTSKNRRGVVVEADRRIAIRQAISLARSGDVLLIAGKGHEDYQILGTTKIHFDDREEARAGFADRAFGKENHGRTG